LIFTCPSAYRHTEPLVCQFELKSNNRMNVDSLLLMNDEGEAYWYRPFP